MYLPTYNEIPSGFSQNLALCVSSSVTLSTVTDLMGENIHAYVRAAGDICSVNIMGSLTSTISLPVGKWVGFGAAIPMDQRKREVFSCSISMLMRVTATPGLMPFIGTTNSPIVALPDGLTTGIRVCAVLPGNYYNVGGMFSVNARASLRSLLVPDQGTMVIGCAVINTHASNAAVIDNFRLTVDANRWSQPDYGLSRPVV